MNWFDKAVAYFNPAEGIRRAQLRSALGVIEHPDGRRRQRRYEAAAGGRRTEGWDARSSGANSEIGHALVRLRDRSRDLVRNDPFAKKAVQTIAANVIGTGIRAAPFGTQLKRVLRIKTLWRLWAESVKCDFDGLNTFYGLQALVMRALAEAGEAIILRRRLSAELAQGGIPLQLQVLEGDFLDHSKNAAMMTGGGYIIQGVEFDQSGRRVAYWIFDRHPGDGMLGYRGGVSSTRRPASDVLHIFDQLRPGQVRGVPWGASAMLTLRDYNDYADAQLMRQKVAACFAVFVKSQTDSDLTDGKDDGLFPDRVEPAMIHKLGAGQDISFASPPPAEGFAEYTKKNLQAVSTGFGVTYEQLTNDLSNVNFSSARMGWLEFSRLVDEWQNLLIIPRLCGPVWDWFVESGRVAGLITGAAPVESGWTTPKREMIDPAKEVRALSDQVRNGFISWSDAVRQLGYDPDELAAALAADAKRFDDLGLKVICDARHFGANGATQPSVADAEGDTPNEGTVA